MGLFDIFTWKKKRQELLIQNAVLQTRIQSMQAELNAVSPQQRFCDAWRAAQ